MIRNLKNKSKTETITAVICSFVFLLIFMLNSVQAAPPVTTVQYFPEGYSIIEQQNNILKLGEPIKYSFLLKNATNGMTVTDSGIDCCRIIISNSQGLNQHIFNFTYNSSNRIWSIDLNKSQILEVFPEVETYNYVICCQSSGNSIGGAISGVLEIVNVNKDPAIYIIILAYLLAIFFLVYSRYTDFNDVLLFFSAIIFIILGLIFLLSDLGFNNKTLTWTFVMINWGVGLVIIFKNIGYWLEGLE